MTTPFAFGRSIAPAARFPRFAAAVAALLLATAASRAEASCGDYLAGPHDMTGEGERVGDGSPVPSSPCHGPGCRRSRDEAPLPPAPHRVTDGAERWGRVSEADAAPPAVSSRLVAEPPPPLPGGLSTRIDRPPRG